MINNMNMKQEEVIEFFTKGVADYNVHSSRKPAEDVIAVCRSLLASISHLNELVQSYGTNANVTERDRDEALISIERKLERRRFYMRYLANQFEETNHNYWCLVKHGMEEMQFAEEVWQADIYNQTLFEAYKDCCQDFYVNFSLWTKQNKLVSCGRCLHDMLTEEDELKEMLEKNNRKNVDNMDDADIMAVPLK